MTWKRIKNKDGKNSKTFKGIEFPCHKISVYKEEEQERYFRKKTYLYSLIWKLNENMNFTVDTTKKRIP